MGREFTGCDWSINEPVYEYPRTLVHLMYVFRLLLIIELALVATSVTVDGSVLSADMRCAQALSCHVRE